jgi:hypothetical protein
VSVWWCELVREFRYYYLYLKRRGIKKRILALAPDIEALARFSSVLLSAEAVRGCHRMVAAVVWGT